jgi:hypothetical protein
MLPGRISAVICILTLIFGFTLSKNALAGSYSFYPSGVVTGFFNFGAEFDVSSKTSLAGEFAVSAWDPMLDNHLKHRITSLGFVLRSYPRGIDSRGMFGGAGLVYYNGDVWKINDAGDTTGYIFDMKGFYTKIIFGGRWFVHKFFISPTLEISEPLGKGGNPRQSGDMTYITSALTISINLRIGIKTNRKIDILSNQE